mmetsp:Transcript_15029/g.30273  ORF Transcript_15029/g.30273 Transcript_15029/m.30273 type:complete len:106 (+) Transcript_15029:86-403(+)
MFSNLFLYMTLGSIQASFLYPIQPQKPICFRKFHRKRNSDLDPIIKSRCTRKIKVWVKSLDLTSPAKEFTKKQDRKIKKEKDHTTSSLLSHLFLIQTPTNHKKAE